MGFSQRMAYDLEKMGVRDDERDSRKEGINLPFSDEQLPKDALTA